MQLFSSAGAESSSPSLPVPLHPTQGQGGPTSILPPPAVAGQLSHGPKEKMHNINPIDLVAVVYFVAQELC